MIFTPPDLYNFLRGPGLIFSILVLFTGTIFRTVQFVRATRRISKIFIKEEYKFYKRTPPAEGSFIRKTILFLQNKGRNTIFGTNPVMALTSLVFHILIFITPLFLCAHNVIADLSAGISLPSLPERVSDLFTLIIISIGVFFFTRRLFVPRVRIISTFRDYLTLMLVMAPFLTALLAHHNFFNYRTAIFTHMIIGEIGIMILPFTSLMHMPFIFLSRFLIDSELSIIPGRRSW